MANQRKSVRWLSGMLWALFLLVYLSAKVDFVVRYGRSDLGTYISAHSHYWAAMVVIGLLLWSLTFVPAGK